MDAKLAQFRAVCGPGYRGRGTESRISSPSRSRPKGCFNQSWVRLHGTEMVQQAGYELTGKFLDERPVAEYRDYVIEQCRGLVSRGEPLASITIESSMVGFAGTRLFGYHSRTMIARSICCCVRSSMTSAPPSRRLRDNGSAATRHCGYLKNVVWRGSNTSRRKFVREGR
jgi:hypothetical protein